MLANTLFVAFGGALGSSFRYGIERLSTHLVPISSIPIANFSANLLGCLLAGIAYGYLEQRELLDSQLRLLLCTGFLGGLTTFSSFGYEAVSLLKQDSLIPCIGYTVGSVAIGMIFVWIGLKIVQVVPG